jgi:hypothetical protein
MHRGHNIRHVCAASDHERPLVDHAIVQTAGVIVTLVVGLDKVTAQARLEFFYDWFIAHNVLLGVLDIAL